jgi:hypothetical protein
MGAERMAPSARTKAHDDHSLDCILEKPPCGIILCNRYTVKSGSNCSFTRLNSTLVVMLVRAALSLATAVMLSAQPDSLTQKSSQAKQLMAEGRFAEAVPLCQELVRALPRPGAANVGPERGVDSGV